MPRPTPCLIFALAASLATPLPAQTPDWVTRVLEAANLPVSTSEARKEGASNTDIQQVLEVLQKEKVPADQAREVIDEERAARRDHGPVDNFGAFVQARLQQGLRGRDLAAAIRAEHAAHGKGKGYDQARQRDGRGKSGEAREGDRTEPGGRPAGAGEKPGDAGKKPEGKGKPEDHPGKPRRR